MSTVSSLTAVPRLLSVAGGYWTGSSAVIDVLLEHDGCRVIEDEFALFSFGQFFAEATDPLLQGGADGDSLAANLGRFEAFNAAERFPLLRKAGRRLFASVGLHPHAWFDRQAGMGARLGTRYQQACNELSGWLRTALSTPREGFSKELNQRLEAVLACDYEGGSHGLPASLRVFDQLVAPPYVDAAHRALPGLRFVHVDRDWRDHFYYFRRYFASMVAKNRALGVRPWDEPFEDSVNDVIDFFVRLRVRIDRLKREQTARCGGYVRWVQFEDLVEDRDRQCISLFEFLDLAPDRWRKNRFFHPEDSRQRIGIWRRGGIDREIAFLTERLESRA